MKKIFIKGNLIVSTPPHCEVITFYNKDVEDCITILGDVKCISIDADMIYVTLDLVVMED